MSGIIPSGTSQKKVSFENLAEEYLKLWNGIQGELKNNNVKALVYGSIALYAKFKDLPESLELIKLGRKNGPQDLNVLVKVDSREKFKELMMKNEFVPYYHLEVTMGNVASMFFYNNLVVKAYYMDKAQFNHEVEVDWSQDYFMSPTDLLLTKLQMHFPTDKDSADIAAILINEDVNKEKIAQHTSKDWGFWKDAVDNLAKAREVVSRLPKHDKLKKIVPVTLKLYGFLNDYPKAGTWKPMEEEDKYWSDF